LGRYVANRARDGTEGKNEGTKLGTNEWCYSKSYEKSYGGRKWHKRMKEEK